MLSAILQAVSGPIHTFEHDVEKLLQQSGHAAGRKYNLRTSPAPASSSLTVSIPTHIDLTLKPYMPAVLDQGQLGACASHAMANALDFTLGKEGKSQFHPSRLALYYNTRVFVEKQSSDEWR